MTCKQWIIIATRTWQDWDHHLHLGQSPLLHPLHEDEQLGAGGGEGGDEVAVVTHRALPPGPRPLLQRRHHARSVPAVTTLPAMEVMLSRVLFNIANLLARVHSVT